MTIIVSKRLETYCAKRPYVRERKIRLTKICASFVCSSESNCFLGRGNGGVFTARRRWRFDTSIFRISKVDPPTNTLAMGTDRFRDSFLDQFFFQLFYLWKPPNWRSWRHDQNKSEIWGLFGTDSQCIYDQRNLYFGSVPNPFCASRPCRARCI